jgi:hypothetical protein
MKPILIFIVVLIGVVDASCGACKSDKRVTGSCFTVHGRLSYYNGTPSTRVWVIGTNHMLSVPSEETELPENLRKLLVTFDDEIYGNFLVCPYKGRRPEHMQPVCIESGKKLFHRRWTQ